MANETRQRILSRALSLASVCGLEQVTLGKLAQASGMSKSGLFAHFTSKEALQLAIVETARWELDRRVVAPCRDFPPGVARIHRFFSLWLEWPEDADLSGGCPIAAGAFEVDDQPGPVRQAVADTLRELLTTLTQWLEEAQALGEVSDFRPASQRAWEIAAAYTMHHVSRRLLDTPECADHAFRALDRALVS